MMSMSPTFEIFNDGVRVIEPGSPGEPRWRAPIGTQVTKLVPIDSDVIVLESYYRFPRDKSNIYRLGRDLAAIWSAERPRRSKDVYVSLQLGPVDTDEHGRGVLVAEGQLAAYTWEGYACLLNAATGRVIREFFSK